MDDAHKTSIHKNRVALINFMGVDSVLPYLSEVLPPNVLDTVKSKRTRHGRVEELLDTIVRYDNTAYEALCRGLLEGSEQPFLVDLLENKQKSDDKVCLQACMDVLSSHYIQYFHELKPLWWSFLSVNIEKIYVDLDLSDRDRSHLKLEQIFDATFDLPSDPTSILLEGPSGSGKTVLSIKLAYDWAKTVKSKSKQEKSTSESAVKKYVDKFKLVFLLQNVDVTSKFDALIFEKNSLFPKDFQYKKELLSVISDPKLQAEVLFVVDVGENVLGDLTRSEAKDSFIVDLIRGDLLKNATVLVTSRPHTARNIAKFNIRLYNNGFSLDTNPSDPSQDPLPIQFIHKFIKEANCDPGKFTTLIQDIRKGHPVLADISRIPLFCLLLCLSYEQEDTVPQGGKFISLAQLLSNLVEDFLLRSVQSKGCEIDDADTELQCTKEILKELCAIAHHCLVQNLDDVPGEVINKMHQGPKNMTCRVFSLGILTPKHKRGSYRRPKTIHQFPHASILEFLAAKHIVCELSIKEQEEFFQRLDTDNSLRSKHDLLWVLICGEMCHALSKNECNQSVLQNLFQFLIRRTDDSFAEDSENVDSISLEHIKKTVSFESFKILFECLYELECAGEDLRETVQDIRDLVVKSMPNSLTSNLCSCRQTCFWGLAKVIEANGPSLERVHLDMCFIDAEDTVESIGKALQSNSHIKHHHLTWQHIERLLLLISCVFQSKKGITLMSCTCNSDAHIAVQVCDSGSTCSCCERPFQQCQRRGSKVFIDASTFQNAFQNASVEQVDWRTCKNPELTNHILGALPNTIKSLSLLRCALDPNTFSQMKQLLKKSALEILVIGFCELLSMPPRILQNISEIGQALTVSRSLVEFHMDGCNVGNSGASDVAKSLCGMKSLRVLSLCSNGIGDEGCSAIANMLKTSMVETLMLDDNEITDKGFLAFCSILGGSLCTGQYLKSLELIGNRITFHTDGEERDFFSAFESFSTLVDLNVSHNEIDESGSGLLVTSLLALRDRLNKASTDSSDVKVVQIACMRSDSQTRDKAMTVLYEIEGMKLRIKEFDSKSSGVLNLTSGTDALEYSVSRISLRDKHSNKVYKQVALDGNTIPSSGLIGFLREKGKIEQVKSKEALTRQSSRQGIKEC